MPTIVELPDKTELEFPDGMDQMAMRGAISKHFPQFAAPFPSEGLAVPEPGQQNFAPQPQQTMERQPLITTTMQDALMSGVRQEPPGEEAEIQPIGQPGTFLHGATSVAAGILNRPEYLAALANPATAAAVGARFLPGVAKQFFEDLGKATQGDNEALGRAAAIGIPALIGGVKAGRNLTQRMDAQMMLEKAQAASSAAHIEALSKIGVREGAPVMEGAPITMRPTEGRPEVLTPQARELTPSEAEVVFGLEKLSAEMNAALEHENVLPNASQTFKEITGEEPTKGAENAQQIEGATALYGNVLRSGEGGTPAGEVPENVGEPTAGLRENQSQRTAPTLSQEKVSGGAPEPEPTPTGPVEPAGAPARDWDAYYESLVGDLDSFSPARQTGKRNYEMDDVAQRFVDYAKQDKSGKPLPELVNDFAKSDEASASQIKKLKASVKNLETPEPTPAPAQAAKGEAPAKEPWQMTRQEFASQPEPDYPTTYRIELDAVANGEKPAHYGFYPVDQQWAQDVYNAAKELGLYIKKGPRKNDYIITRDTESGRARASTIYTSANDAVRDPSLLDDITWHDRFGKLLGYGPEFEGRIQAISGPKVLENKRLHRYYVSKAVREGKPVAPEVLADYPDLAPKASQPPTPETGPGMSVGPGAASPTDITQPGTVVSNMFAAIDRDRAALGKPPMEPGEPRTWDQDRQIATARMNRDPQWIPDLIKEVAAKPRPLFSWENAGMVIQKAYWKAEANNALRRIANAVDSSLAEDELVRAKADAARFEDNIAEMEEAVGRGGTGSEAGRTLQAQKMGVTDDLSLVEMRLEMRGQKGGKPLTEAESRQIEQIHKDYQQKISALEKATADADKRRIDAETRATLAELARQSAEKQVPPPHIQNLINRVGETIHSRAEAARARLRGKLFTLSPEVLRDLAEVGADNIWTIGEDFTRWSAKMVSDIGEHVKPHLDAVWAASKKLVADTFDSAAAGARKAGKVVTPKTVDLAKETLKKGDSPQQQRTKLVARIVDRFTKKQLDKITPAVQRLARTFVDEGIRDRDELIDAVHGVLRDVLPDWSRRDTMDAISGYGDYKTLSKDEVSVALRDLKGQMQQIAKLEDMAGGQAPLRTGLERREVTKAQSELIKLVNEAKRKGGYETTDPTTQLRTALDEVKKRTQSQIDEYQRRLDQRDFSVRKLEPIKPDAELTSKQADLKRVRKQWEQVKREKALADRHLWQRVLDRFVRWNRAFLLSSPTVFGKLADAAVTRVAETAASETAGTVLRLVPGISEVARQAPREGGPINVREMAKALASAVTRKGMSDAWQTARKGAADIDVQYGEKMIDRDWVNFFGQLHGMIKAPVKRFEIEYALSKRIEHYIRTNGEAPDPVAMTGLISQAVSDGYRAIFMQRGFSSDMFNQVVSQMERSRNYPITGEVAARVARFLMPIVRVPVNIVSETATGIAGAPLASMRTLFHAVNGTLDKLEPKVADSIMRQFKKGLIGLGLMAVGYFNPQMVGGYDWREKRKPGAAKTSGFQIPAMAGIFPADKYGNLPRWMTHGPWFELMQFGATIRHVEEQHIASTGAHKGIPEGVRAASLGLLEETPFYGELLTLARASESQSGSQKFAGDIARRVVVPQGVQAVASLTDRPSLFGETVRRRPRNIVENVKMGIPGLRQQVPKARVR